MSSSCTLLPFIAWMVFGTISATGGEPPAGKQHLRKNRPGDARDALPAGTIARLGETRFWSRSQISSLAFSPDSKTLAAAVSHRSEGDKGPAIRLLEIASGTERRRLRDLPGGLAAVAFSPDGKSLAGINDWKLFVWEVAAGTLRHRFTQQKKLSIGLLDSPSMAVAYSPDGRCLAATEGEAVSLRDVATGQELRWLQGHATEVIALAFSPDGKILASSSFPKFDFDRQPGVLRLWNVASGKLLREITYGGLPPLQIAPFGMLHFCNDGKTLAAWGRHTSVVLFDVATGREIHKFTDEFATIAFSTDGKLLATAGPTIRLWELPAGRQLRSFPGGAAMRLLTFSPDGKTLAAVSGDGSDHVRLWDVARGEEIVSYPGHRGAVQSLSCPLDGKTLFSAGSDGTIRLWDVAQHRQRRVLEEHTADYRALAVSADGKIVAAMDADDAVTFWSAAGEKLGHVSGTTLGNFLRPNVFSKPLLAFLADGRSVAAGRADGRLRIWKDDLAKAPRTLHADADKGVPAAITPDSSLVASLAEGVIRLRRLDPGKEVGRIKGEGQDAFWAAAFSPDGKILAVSRSLIHVSVLRSGILDHRLLFWEVASGQRIHTIDLRNYAQTLVFSADVKRLATAGGELSGNTDRSICIWDVTTGKLLEKLPGHGCQINALLFSPDGRWLFSGAVDGSILIWDTRWPHPRPRRTPGELTAEQLNSAWKDLAGEDAAQAFRSLSDLAADPLHAVSFIREHLPKPPPFNRALIARLIADLDSGDFVVREKARVELERQGELAKPALRKTLQSRPSLEVQRRVEELLERLHRFPPPAEKLRMSRAMLALEWMDTAEARRLIETLAQGTPGAALTREAKAALRRRYEPRP